MGPFGLLAGLFAKERAVPGPTVGVRLRERRKTDPAP
jgi:hypothetical protein